MLRRNNTNLVQADGDLDRDTIIMERGRWNFRCLCRYLEADTRGEHYVGCILATLECAMTKLWNQGMMVCFDIYFAHCLS